jgi:signal transduction histidine kinase
MTVRAREQKVELAFDPGDSIPAVTLDQQGIYRCVLNLVSNAIAACETDGGAVAVRTGMDEPGEVSIEVTDEGIGMAPETLASIFQPFFSLKGSKGTGLGLSVTRKIVQEHGGSVNVTSAPGKGSTFTIALPISREPVPADR